MSGIKRNRSRIKFKTIVVHIVLILLTLLCLFPFYILIINSTRYHPDIQKGFAFLPGRAFRYNLNNLLSDPNLPVLRALRNSFIISASTAILSTYFSTLTAFAIHAYDFKAKKAVFTFILMIMMVPTQVSTLGFVNLVRRMNLLDNFIPLIVPTIASPIVFFFIKQYMENSLPMEIVEAARIDGAHEFRLFNTIIIPITKPAIAVQMIFTFTSSWNNYFIPSLVLNDAKRKTLPILIAQLRSADFLKFDMGKVYMLIALSIFPVVLVYIFLSKSIIQGVAIGSVKG